MNVIYANLGAAAAAIIVLLLRRVLKKRVPPAVFVTLWLLVLIRVLIPVQAATHLSVFPAESALAVSANGEFEHGEDASDFVMPQFGAQADGEQQGAAQNGAQAEISAQSGRKMTAIQVLSLVYIGGAVLLAMYFGFGHAVMLRRCNGFEHEKGAAANEILRCFDKSGKIALLVSTDACSPFSIGIIKPKIVLPPDCKAEQLRFVLAHEYVHIRDRDSVARLLGLAAVCAGWFNPFVWIAFKYLDRDLERFCDERALRLLGAENAPRYALTLLDFAERQMQSAAVQSFAAAPLEERVNDILNMKKRKTSMLAEAVLVAAALLAMTACGTAALAAEAPQAAAGEQTAVIKVEVPAGDSGARQPEIPAEKPPKSAACDDSGVIKIDAAGSESVLAERTAYRTYDRKWDFYDIFSSDYARPTKYANSVLWTSEGFVYIDGTKGEDVFSTKSGTVKDLGYTSTGYGTMLIIEHDDGTAVIYCHLNEILVEVGDRVKQGDVIATLGSSGNTKTPVCGFEIIENGVTPLHSEENMYSEEYFLGKVRQRYPASVFRGEESGRKAYPTYDRKWDFYDIFTSDYARPTKYASSVLWTSEGFVYIDGTKGEDVFSTKSGTVKNVGLTSSGYGYIIIIEHDDGTAAVYCHLKEILVDTGDRVEQGDVIATVGTSGNAATPILGFEIIENGVTPLHPEKTVQSVDYFVSIIREK